MALSTEIRIANEEWEAVATAHGAQVLAFRSRLPEAHPILWLGKKADFSPGSAIRGGIPLCWPWFGAAPQPGLPVNGMVRTEQWTLAEHTGISAKYCTRQIFDETQFELSLSVALSTRLELELACTSLGSKAVRIECALHTYLAVGDVDHISVSGLQGFEGEDFASGEKFVWRGEFVPSGECRKRFPRVSSAELHDKVWHRKIRLESTIGSGCFLWNPGSERCAGFADMEKDEYRRMFCIESTFAGDDAWRIKPGETRQLKMSLSEHPE